MESENVKRWMELAIDVERFAIEDYKRALERYNNAKKVKDADRRKRKLYKWGRAIDKLEEHFKEDIYGVFNGSGPYVVSRIKKEIGFKRVEEVTFSEYKEILIKEYAKSKRISFKKKAKIERLAESEVDYE